MSPNKPWISKSKPFKPSEVTKPPVPEMLAAEKEAQVAKVHKQYPLAWLRFAACFPMYTYGARGFLTVDQADKRMMDAFVRSVKTLDTR